MKEFPARDRPIGWRPIVRRPRLGDKALALSISQPGTIRLAVQQKTRDTALAVAHELAFLWQEEVWDSPDTVATENTRNEKSESPAMEALIQLVLRSNDSVPDITTEKNSEE